MTGQNQYDPARPLTSHPTQSRRQRTAFPLLAGLFGLCVLAAAAPSTIALDAPAAGAWLTIVLGMSFSSREQRARRELPGRLEQFRHEVAAAGHEPTRERLRQLLALAKELELPDAEITDDLARIQASLDALTLRESLKGGVWPVVPSPETHSPGDPCHFMCPVRFGRRRADQYGHLVLTRDRLKFRGALDVSVAWTEIASVERAERELIVGLQDSRRMLRFSCHTFDEAARGGVIASELARLAAEAAPAPAPSAPYHAV